MISLRDSKPRVDRSLTAPAREVIRFKKDELDVLAERMMRLGIIKLSYTARSVRQCAAVRRRVNKYGVSVHTRSYPSSNTLKAWFVVTR